MTEWTKHETPPGECPYPPGANVKIRRRDGRFHGTRLASSLDWSERGDETIVESIVVESIIGTPEEEEAWKEKQTMYRPATTEHRMKDAMPIYAAEFATRAADLLDERGKTYDRDGSERSMARTVAAFNAVTGKELTEWEGWLLMSLLKRVRQASSPSAHRDSAEDAVAYAALEAECLLGGDK